MRRRISLSMLMVIAIIGCSSPSSPAVGGETHWLRACAADDECGDEDLTCVCGTCTRACSGSDPCAGGPPATCFDRRSPLLLQRCGGSEPDLSAGVCLRECTSSSECTANHACVEDACVPALPAEDAAAPHAGSNEASSVSISDFDDVSDNVDWDVPIQVPTMSPVVVGGDARIIGTWLESGCDPAQPPLGPPHGCVRMELEQNAAGEVTGTARIERSTDIPSEPPMAPAVGYPPAEDPDVGYPRGVDPMAYADLLADFQAGVPYRILDGRFANGRLTFVWSYFDLWHDWCVLQAHYPWQVGDHAFSFCVPQDRETWATIDEGKIVLCTSADFEPLCGDNGSLWPCPCVDGNSNPRCSPAYCHCNARGCDADVHADYIDVELMVEGETMLGTWEIGADRWSGPLRRVSK